MNTKKEMQRYADCEKMSVDELRSAYVEKSIKIDSLIESFSKVIPVIKNLSAEVEFIHEIKRIIQVGGSLGTTINKDWCEKNKLQKGDHVNQLTITF